MIRSAWSSSGSVRAISRPDPITPAEDGDDVRRVTETTPATSLAVRVATAGNVKGAGRAVTPRPARAMFTNSNNRAQIT